MEKYILVEYLSTLNAVIDQTFQSTQRIKLSSFEVSRNYIIFGTSSGGIYIFKREPCEFFKLIPSKEGFATKIVISRDEKCLAVASSKGLIIILENFIVDLNLRPLVFTEHEGNNITAMVWHGQDVYVGDNNGKISIITLNNLLTKAIFQSPVTVLMQLDTPIVQLDTYLNYLLISTYTRTYLCDTQKEQYKQIGKKLRDGGFGACFFNSTNLDLPDNFQGSRGIFKTINENENLTPVLNKDVKIFCARPGARLWEANFEPTVIVTHQFRESLKQSPSDLIYIKDNLDEAPNIFTFEGTVLQNFNFGKIFPFCDKFILTYDNNGIYFFDHSIGKLIFWSNKFKSIKDIKILNSSIYIWQDNLELNLVSLVLLEELIIKHLMNKQYYLSANLCALYNNDVLSLIGNSKKIHLISILKNKLIDMNSLDLLDKIKPILQNQEEYNKKYKIDKEITNGIVLIQNDYVMQNLDYLPESVLEIEKLAFNTQTEDSSKEIIHDLENQISSDKTEEEQNMFSEQKKAENFTKFSNLYTQFKLNKTHKDAELTESSILLDCLNLDDCLALLDSFMEYVEKSHNEDATMWCKEQFLKQATKKSFEITNIQPNTFLFLSQSFLELNISSDLTCKCNFPLPIVHKKVLKYYKLGCKIFNHLDNVDEYLKSIPYMYKYKLSQIDNLSDILLNLNLMIQFSDKKLVEQFITLFTYDTWDELIKLNIKLKQNICLNCGDNINTDGLWSWTDLGLLLIQSIGSKNTSRLLKRYSQHIPNGDLDSKFYQSCILASTFDEAPLALKFMDKVVDDSTSQKFDDLMEKFLQRRYLGNNSLTIEHKMASEILKCTYCDLEIKGPILNEYKTCDCGHSFHSLCYTHNKGLCNICSGTVIQ